MTSAERGPQIALDLRPARARQSRADYVVSDENRDALETLDRWPASGELTLAICGPRASGKSHLAAILSAATGAPALDARHALVAPPAAAIVIFDNIDRAASPMALLELLEAARVGRQRLALVGQGAPRSWAGGQRDLETRLAAMPRIDLGEPGEALLAAVLTKLLGDRQLRATAPIAAYAAPRLPRTFAAASRFIAALDAAALAAGAPVSLKLAREVLANLSEAHFEA